MQQRPFAVVLSFLVVTAGCGNGGSEEATPSTAPATTVARPTTVAVTTTSDVTTTSGLTMTMPESTTGPLAGIGELELIEDRFGWAEGPQWLPDMGVLLFTDGSGTIYEVDADDEISVFRQPSNGANGLAIDPEGRLIAAENTRRRVTRTESDGTVTPIAEQFEGVPLNQPNDIAVRSDGTIYFTDPYYGEGSRDLDFHGVFRIAPDGALTAERRGALTEQPNGIALSPDETLLYVANQADNLVWVFDVSADGSLSEARTFVTIEDSPDGMAVDHAGNLFVASFGGIEVFAPDATRWGVIPVPSTNCAFGGADGRTLYITQPERLYRVTLENPGPY